MVETGGDGDKLDDTRSPTGFLGIGGGDTPGFRDEEKEDAEEAVVGWGSWSADGTETGEGDGDGDGKRGGVDPELDPGSGVDRTLVGGGCVVDTVVVAAVVAIVVDEGVGFLASRGGGGAGADLLETWTQSSVSAGVCPGRGGLTGVGSAWEPWPLHPISISLRGETACARKS